MIGNAVLMALTAQSDPSEILVITRSDETKPGQISMQEVLNREWKTGEISCVIHCGWNGKDRSYRAQMESANLALNIRHSINQDSYFLFVSSKAAETSTPPKSNYGVAKLHVERNLAESKSGWLRPGFVINQDWAGISGSQIKKFWWLPRIKLFPRIQISIIDLNDLVENILWSVSHRAYGLVQVNNHEVNFEDLVNQKKTSRLVLTIPQITIDCLLAIVQIFPRGRNYCDRWRSLTDASDYLA